MAERLTIDSETLDVLDLVGAVQAEAEAPANLLPRGLVEDLLAEKAPEIASNLKAQLQNGFEVLEPEILAAAKAARGRRPVAILPVAERVTYRALVMALAPSLPRLDRTNSAYEAFKQAPLDVPTTQFVVMADVSSCYEYIDHGLLHEELLALTGQPAVSNAIADLLHALFERGFGLPQNRPASHTLAEVVLDIAERSLLRDGHKVWRYSDDFRISADSRSEAHVALQHLEDQMRRLGFTLNDEKTSIKPRAAYEASANAVANRLAEVQNDVTFDLGAFLTYEGEPVEPEQSEVEAASALRLLELWQEDVDEERNQYGPEAAVNRLLLRAAFIALTTAMDPRGLDLSTRVVDLEPSLTPQVALYWTALIRPSPIGLEDLTDWDAPALVDSLLSQPDGYLSDWQAAWLFEPLRAAATLTPTQQNWVRDRLDSASNLVRAGAASVLARHHAADADELAAMFNAATEPARVRLVEAIALATADANHPGLRAITRERPLYRWIAEKVLGS
jgi:hypothetical protein